MEYLSLNIDGMMLCRMYLDTKEEQHFHVLSFFLSLMILVPDLIAVLQSKCQSK